MTITGMEHIYMNPSTPNLHKNYLILNLEPARVTKTEITNPMPTIILIVIRIEPDGASKE